MTYINLAGWIYLRNPGWQKMPIFAGWIYLRNPGWQKMPIFAGWIYLRNPGWQKMPKHVCVFVRDVCLFKHSLNTNEVSYHSLSSYLSSCLCRLPTRTQPKGRHAVTSGVTVNIRKHQPHVSKISLQCSDHSDLNNFCVKCCSLAVTGVSG